MKSDALTIGEAAARLGVHRNTVRNWIERGLLAGIPEGRRVLIPADALAAFAGRRCVLASCGKPFTAADPRQRYCSAACRWTATYERRKAAHSATRGPGRPAKEPLRKAAPRRAAPDRLRAALDFAKRASDALSGRAKNSKLASAGAFEKISNSHGETGYPSCVNTPARATDLPLQGSES